MCYRQLRFTKNTACGHLTFQGDTYIDCLARDCKLSASHPTTCGSQGRPASGNMSTVPTMTGCN
ncbi:hypothetical protein BDR03DRAFT_391593 [Suillus americanus]|nr:hypothetical protein BDR03DRAFT_391593 [Suillus americanus]